MKSSLLALLLLIGNWIEEFRRQAKHTQAQEERDLSENDPVTWFDDEFGADGWVQYSDQPDATGTDQTNTD